MATPHTPTLRRTRWLDNLLSEANRAMQVLAGVAHANRPNPADAPATTPVTAPNLAPGPEATALPASISATTPGTHPELSAAERAHAARLMRVNHVGEICAQALYRGQASLARNTQTRALLEQAAQEEVDHLAWLNQRLRELDGRPSLLNPVWYAGSFLMGAVAARAGTPWNLGFMAETERQVGEHLNGHLQQLPANDQRSRDIVQQMRLDEAGHQRQAEQAGGQELPAPVKFAMRGMAKVMTTTAHWV